MRIKPEVMKRSAETFAAHLSKVFEPNPCEFTLEEENWLSGANTLTTRDAPTRPFTVKEVRAAIRELKQKERQVMIL